MNNHRPLHPEFEGVLSSYDDNLVALYMTFRNQLLQLAPGCNELLYNSHALTIAFSLSEKLSGAFCHLPIYQSHINLGFNQGAFLEDPNGILQGTGKTIRHIRMTKEEDFNQQAIQIVKKAIALAETKVVSPSAEGKIISHLKH